MNARIREATADDAPAIARVQVASWRVTYRGIVPDAYLDALSEGRRAEGWRQILSGGEPDTFAYVAQGAVGDIAGFASGGAERSGDPLYRGELQAIYLLPTHQRHGLGRALTAAVARRLATLELRSMLLWVLTENHPARRFYEALGGVPARIQTIDIGGVPLEEIAYGWRDTAVLE